jgi:hypothetical protein
MTTKVEIRGPQGQVNSSLTLRKGESFSHPLKPSHFGIEELLTVWENGGYTRSTRVSFGPIKGQWQGEFNHLEPGVITPFTGLPDRRIRLLNLG